MRKISLTLKGLLLVSIPLVFEIGFAAFLWNLQQEADAETKEALKQHNISACINDLSSDAYRLWDTFRDSRTGANWMLKNFRKTIYFKFIYELRDNYAKLDMLSSDNPELNASAKRGEAVVRQGIYLIVKMRERVNSQQHVTFEDYQPTVDKLRDMYQDMISEVMSLSALHERMFAESKTLAQIDHRNQILKCLLAFVSVMGAFSVFSAIFVFNDLIAKLKVMSDNARRVSLFEPLNAPVGGNDEIAELDRAFHWMNESLLDSARARQEVYAMVTHDLRTPLTVIKGSLEMLETGRSHELGELNELGDRTVRLMVRNCTLMMGLINDLLDLEKINTGTFSLDKEEVCLADIFEEVRLLIADWCATHGLTLTVEDTALFVYADHALLSRVLYNLVSNAAKNCPSGGKISLHAIEREKDIEITVSDTGKGIPENMLKSIFDRFRQVDDGSGHKKRSGSGLGLTICKSVVELHGGRIWATSPVGEGATFHMVLPKV